MPELSPEARDRAAQRAPNAYSGGPARSERELALEAQIAELEMALGELAAEGVEPALDVFTDRDALKARVELLTAALTEIVAATDASTDQLPRSMWSALTRARAALAAAVEKDSE